MSDIWFFISGPFFLLGLMQSVLCCLFMLTFHHGINRGWKWRAVLLMSSWSFLSSMTVLWVLL